MCLLLGHKYLGDQFPVRPIPVITSSAIKSTPYSRIEPVLTACRVAGVTSLELATRQDRSPKGGR